jgi:transketolase
MEELERKDIDRDAINTIRTLAIDAVEAAKSGHPGAPMALAPVAYVLWQRVLRFDPDDPLWPDRDRFVLSNGHASALLYALLHLTGVRAVGPSGEVLDSPAMPLEELKRFRQLGSRTPGHPERGCAAGVEATTGPLGQGIGDSVGLAIAGRWLAARYDRPGHAMFRFRVFAMCGDGDLMEGVGSEAASLAGHLRLGNLCWIYDDNRVSLSGPTSMEFTEDVGARFRAYGWAVERVEDANDLAAVEAALGVAVANTERPTLIMVRSHIGYGAPHVQDTYKAHGEALGPEEARLAKRAYGWPEDAHFLVPPGVREAFAAGVGARGRRLRAEWQELFASYRKAFPGEAGDLDRIARGTLPDGWDAALPTFAPDPKGVATRDASGKVLNALAARIPWIVGGDADLFPSTKTRLTAEGAGDLAPDQPGGRNIHFGVREHAMGAAINGLALAGLRSFGATFLVFSDYARPAIRLAALMRVRIVWIFTHDSISLGEDGPTHQPIEQLPALRAIPRLVVLRPADAGEVVEAWRVALAQDGPVALVLTRQAIPVLDRTRVAPAAGVAQGAYVLRDPPGGPPQALLLATGSEVALALAAQDRLLAGGIRVRVVSMPSWELFARQPRGYQDTVLPPEIRARVAVEEASPFGWDRWVGAGGTVVAMRGFGASAPRADVERHFGFTPEAVADAVRAQLAAEGGAR